MNKNEIPRHIKHIYIHALKRKRPIQDLLKPSPFPHQLKWEVQGLLIKHITGK